MQTVAQLNALAAREQDKVNQLSNAADALASNIQFAKSNEADNEDPNPYLSPVAATYIMSKKYWTPQLRKEDKTISKDEQRVVDYRQAAQTEQEQQQQSEEGWSYFFSAIGIFLMILAM